jgi:hypothetical protein
MNKEQDYSNYGDVKCKECKYLDILWCTHPSCFNKVQKFDCINGVRTVRNRVTDKEIKNRQGRCPDFKSTEPKPSIWQIAKEFFNGR